MFEISAEFRLQNANKNNYFNFLLPIFICSQQMVVKFFYNSNIMLNFVCTKLYAGKLENNF